MELLALFDENNKVLAGESISRDKKSTLCASKRYKVVMIWIQNSKDEFLIQLTSPEKNFKYATTGGHVKFGADTYQTLLEEVKEELGYSLDIKKVEHIDTIATAQAFIEVFYMREDIELDSLVLQKEEVDSVYWYSIDIIKELFKKDLFLNAHKLVFERCFLSKK